MMDKDGLLKSIAETGYNVGFGAKKHFATYDLIEKAPGWIGFISTAVGILGLIFDQLSAKLPSAALLILGVSALYIAPYDSKKAAYDEAGSKLTQLFNRLRNLYRAVQAGADVQSALGELNSIEAEYYASCISKQLWGSDWYAHYKFFVQQQIDWINEQKKFTWRDKVPPGLIAFVLLAATLAVISVVYALRIPCGPAAP